MARLRMAVLLVATMTSAVCSCTGALENETVEASVSSSRRLDSLVAATQRYWPQSGGPALIPVCFEPSVSPINRTIIQEHAVKAWQRYARVTLLGWGDCTAGTQGLHVNQTDHLGSTSPIGTQGNGGLNGEVINLDPFDNTPDGGRFAAVVGHEFGHALGFHHEECRPGYIPTGDQNLNGIQDQNEPACLPQDCTTGKPAANWPNRTYGAYDVWSIMSGCGRHSTTLPTFSVAPSPNDIASVQTVYGRKSSGQLVSTHGRCATMPNASQGVVLDCMESSSGDKFRFNVPMQRFEISGACLESAPTGTSASVYLYPACDGYSGQAWRFESVFVRGWGGLCLDLENGNTSGGRVQLFSCGALGGANQKWTLTPSGELRFGLASAPYCLTMTSSNEMRVQTCLGTTNQQFDILGTGQIRVRSSGLCADASGPTSMQYSPSDGSSGMGLPSNGTSIQAYTCLTEQLNQKFNFSGQIKHVSSGSCLERAGEGVGSLLTRTPCATNSLQVWDYYPL